MAKSKPTKKINGVYIAATGQNNGKTTTSLAIYQKLSESIKKMSFMKPVGQRTIEFTDGIEADEDVLLMKRVFNLKRKASFMSPVTVPAGFTRKYLDGELDNSILQDSVEKGFQALSSGGSTVIAEGTGHGGVGSVFDMSNARVAKILGLPVIIVTEGGIGRPLDALAVNFALFQKEGVEVKGVIFNKVHPSKAKQVRHYCGKFLSKYGIEVLGVVEYSEVLAKPSLGRLCIDMDAELLGGKGKLAEVPLNIVIGAAKLDDILELKSDKTLIVTPATRSDIMTLATHNYLLQQIKKTKRPLNIMGIVLTGKIDPHPLILKQAQDSGIPILRTTRDVYETLRVIHKSLAKILPEDTPKLEQVRDLYRNSLNWKRINEIVQGIG